MPEPPATAGSSVLCVANGQSVPASSSSLTGRRARLKLSAHAVAALGVGDGGGSMSVNTEAAGSGGRRVGVVTSSSEGIQGPRFSTLLPFANDAEPWMGVMAAGRGGAGCGEGGSGYSGRGMGGDVARLSARTSPQPIGSQGEGPVLRRAGDRAVLNAHEEEQGLGGGTEEGGNAGEGDGRQDADKSPEDEGADGFVVVPSQASVCEIPQTQGSQCYALSQAKDDGHSGYQDVALATSSSSPRVASCFICGQRLSLLSPSEKQVHVNACLDGRRDSRVASQHRCIVCASDLSGLSSEGRERHTNACLDGRGNEACGEALGALSPGGGQRHAGACAGMLPPSNARDCDEESTWLRQSGRGRREGKVIECGICGKDLSGYSTAWRIEHANECCDSEPKRVEPMECGICGRDMSGWDVDYR